MRAAEVKIYICIDRLRHSFRRHAPSCGRLGVTILVLEILGPRTKIFAGKYGMPLEKSVGGLKTLILLKINTSKVTAPQDAHKQ